MTTLQFADTHNLVPFLAKPAESRGFEQVVDFLNASSIRYALTVNPTIYTSCIEQFWATVKVKTVNGEQQLQALVDGMRLVLLKHQLEVTFNWMMRKALIACLMLPFFEELTRIGAKTTAWNEFSSTMASAIICLSTTPNAPPFPISFLESMVKNLDNAGKFLMYPRRWQEKKDFLEVKTPLFPTMLVQDHQENRQYEAVNEKPRGCIQTGAGKIDDIDKDAEITLVDETQGRYGDEDMFGVNDLDGDDVVVESEVTDKTGWKPKDLKNKSFTNIQELFDKAMKRVNTFVDMDTKLVEGSEVRAEGSETREESSSKRVGFVGG
ncbi:hypothetical protein Tco_0604026 [Tanacetum coccineum]